MISRGHGHDVGEIGFARAGDRALRELLEQRVRLATEHPIALLDRRVSEGLGHVTLAGARRPDDEDVLVLRSEAAGGELEDERAIEMLAKGEIKGV